MAKGMILAAGEGTRLWPLTRWMPKPLLPVANVPAMVYGIRCLRSAGITEIGVNVHYMAQKIIDTIGDGTTHGVRFHWSREEDLLGTAGGMKKLQPALTDDVVVVIAGDAVLDIDLISIIQFHRETQAIATIGMVSVEDPSQYGVVLTEPDGRIIEFQEKPPNGTQISNDVNTGIYVFDQKIFELIPEGKPWDFAKNVFPELLERGLPFYAKTINGYWTDIGTISTYLQANLDCLTGQVHTNSKEPIC